MKKLAQRRKRKPNTGGERERFSLVMSQVPRPGTRVKVRNQPKKLIASCKNLKFDQGVAPVGEFHKIFPGHVRCPVRSRSRGHIDFVRRKVTVAGRLESGFVCAFDNASAGDGNTTAPIERRV